MTQSQLAEMLQRKLGFQSDPNEPVKKARVLGPSPLRLVKSRARKRGSIRLMPPDGYLKRTYLLSFNLRQTEVEQAQISKVKDETGLNYSQQRDLAECRLDAEVAQLLFYCFKIAELTKDSVTMDLVCDYIADVRQKLKTPRSGEEFWLMKRRRYLTSLAKLRRDISDNRSRSHNEAIKRCLTDFLDYISNGWSLPEI